MHEDYQTCEELIAVVRKELWERRQRVQRVECATTDLLGMTRKRYLRRLKTDYDNHEAEHDTGV